MKDVFLNHLISESNDFIFLLNTDFEFLNVWTKRENKLFFRPEILLGKKTNEVIKGELGTELTSVLDKALRTKETQYIDYKSIYKANVFYRAKIYPFKENGHWFLVSYIKDITELKKKEDLLIKQNHILEEAQNIAQIGAWELDIVHKKLWWSDELFSVLNEKKGSIDPNLKNLLSFVHHDDRNLVKTALQYSLQTGREHEATYRLKLRNGEIKFVKEKGKIYYNGDKPVRVLGTIRDITEQIHQENILKEKNDEIEAQNEELRITNEDLIKANEISLRNQAYYKTIFEYAPIGIVHYDEKGIITNCNEIFASIIGVHVKQLIGLDMIHKLTDKNMVREVRRTLKSGVGYFEGLYKTLNTKKKIFIRVKGKAILNQNNKIIGGVSTVEDISEIKKYESDLKEAKNKAEQSNRLKSAFLANMSHEIRTPMNAILGFTQIIDERLKENDELKRFTKIIKNSGKLLLSLINDILDLSKIEAGELKLDCKEFDINTLLDSVLELIYAYQKEKKKKQLYIKLHKQKKSLVICSDAGRISQILMNLLSNAIKFTEKGRIDFGYKTRGKNITLFVKDTGIGIDTYNQNLVFERFMQADLHPKEIHSGTGLGLSLSKSLTELLGGKIRLNSVRYEGTTVELEIPMFFNCQLG